MTASAVKKPLPGELMKAVKAHNTSAVEDLLQRGADVNEEEFLHGMDNLNRDMLNLAAELGYTDIVGLLVGNGAAINRKGPGGLTPLMQAVRMGHVETARLLIDRGADTTLSTFDGPGGNHTVSFANGCPRQEEMKKILKEAPELQRRRAAEAETQIIQAYHTAAARKQQRLKAIALKVRIQGSQP